MQQTYKKILNHLSGHSEQKKSRHLKSKSWRLPMLASFYVLAYVIFDLMADGLARHYIFCIFLVVSSLYFSWRLGGRETMTYVGFFNIFFAFIFSRLLYMTGNFSSKLFLSRSFMTLYVVAIIFMFIMTKRKSPADREKKEREKSIREERQKRRQLELMVATEKLTDDMITQANMVKDELMVLQNSWKSQIHTIVNDLPKVKERELYNQIVTPFEESIVEHLRDLEKRLSFKPQLTGLDELAANLTDRLENDQKHSRARLDLKFDFEKWIVRDEEVLVDRYKTWEILLNLIRNSQTAMELRQIELLRQGSEEFKTFKPRLSITADVQDNYARLRVTDTGGGVSDDSLQDLFKRAVPSAKRNGKAMGQGTVFVKFFGDNMGFDISASNTDTLGSKGLEVTILIPLGTFGPAGAIPVTGDE
ncbi:ATP-binding protein [Maridesulfovibrio salexigens]|uniref:Histidine kinase n=1 Tax=Maridesulfovibrio salexigens (strain ATCC 14822 / DSM 2638 / NCIMB 8403 / VKM B-1763) TaxID=526222 RepID=C6BTG3_MARSD|nr:ATP-binding protein [Maridesulfovibrio salexigens]ACS81644.1 histidine kinase [Maridesulfovibrio salexigens DSM 2638]